MAAAEDFCPIVAATDLLGQKWTLLLVHFLYAASPERVRFCELQKQLGGLNPATLTQRLKLLESEGLVERVEVNSLPPHVEYGLTRKGSGLGPVVEGLNDWGSKWLTPTKSRNRRNSRN
jgi:DNA-binding HxlR family transcriptional regulator